MWPIRVVAIICSIMLSACEPGTGPGNDDGLEGELDSEYGSGLDGLDDYEDDAGLPMLTHGGLLARGGKVRPAASMSSFHLAGSRPSAVGVPLPLAGASEDIMCGWSGP